MERKFDENRENHPSTKRRLCLSTPDKGQRKQTSPPPPPPLPMFTWGRQQSRSRQPPPPPPLLVFTWGKQQSRSRQPPLPPPPPPASPTHQAPLHVPENGFSAAAEEGSTLSLQHQPEKQRSPKTLEKTPPIKRSCPSTPNDGHTNQTPLPPSVFNVVLHEEAPAVTLAECLTFTSQQKSEEQHHDENMSAPGTPEKPPPEKRPCPSIADNAHINQTSPPPSVFNLVFTSLGRPSPSPQPPPDQPALNEKAPAVATTEGSTFTSQPQQQETQGKTPRKKKPKRKKIRGKVLRDGMKVRTPKKPPGKPMEPKTQEKPRTKRKYVKRKGVDSSELPARGGPEPEVLTPDKAEENSRFKRKYERKKAPNSAVTPSSRAGGNAEVNGSESPQKKARKSLKFDVELEPETGKGGNFDSNSAPGHPTGHAADNCVTLLENPVPKLQTNRRRSLKGNLKDLAREGDNAETKSDNDSGLQSVLEAARLFVLEGSLDGSLGEFRLGRGGDGGCEISEFCSQDGAFREPQLGNNDLFSTTCRLSHGGIPSVEVSSFQGSKDAHEDTIQFGQNDRSMSKRPDAPIRVHGTNLASATMESFQGVVDSGLCSGPLVLYSNPRKRNPENSDKGCKEEAVQTENAIVPYKGYKREVASQVENAIVPHKNVDQIVPYSTTKKKEKTWKADVDREFRKFILLLKEEISVDEEMNADDKKQWEEQRRVFEGRALLIIARMNQVQGDRSFSRWKGSVLDSVIGVFLTQNCSDILSSNAYISLASRFPCRLKGNSQEFNTERSGPSYQIVFPLSLTRNEDGIEGHSETDISLQEIEIDLGNAPPDLIGTPLSSKGNDILGESEDRTSPDGVLSSQDSAFSSQNSSDCPTQMAGKGKGNKKNAKKERGNNIDYESLIKETYSFHPKNERNPDTTDSIDWESIRCADVNKIAEAIRDRGQNFIIATRIKNYLNRLLREHGSLDVEWLRDIPPDKAEDYLLSIDGLGPKSTDCVRLLSLYHHAFPVDTNICRIAVRLGWVPLQPLPESTQLHILELYPIFNHVQTYLWPRLCNLDKETLYQLHYHMITIGKVFCTKTRPNCNACPLKNECKHYASANASARLALQSAEEKVSEGSIVALSSKQDYTAAVYPTPLPQLEGIPVSKGPSVSKDEPFVEFPTTPEHECQDSPETFQLEEIEDYGLYKHPSMMLTMDEVNECFAELEPVKDRKLQDDKTSKALVLLDPGVAPNSGPKLKASCRLRTEHQVYVLPDWHPLLECFDRRDPGDKCPYLLAIWRPGETAHSSEPPQMSCTSQGTGNLCDMETCGPCNSLREANADKVRGTILIPCRTAMRGRFPLNGTYFQTNEVFADHETSFHPIDVPGESIWHLKRRVVYFGSSITSICRDQSFDGIAHCFLEGFICVRGFDRETRLSQGLAPRLYLSPSKVKPAAKGKGERK